MIQNKEEAMELINEFYADEKELKAAIKNDEIYDALPEMADGAVDIYNADLFEWVAAGDNYQHIEDAVEELGFAKNAEGKPDFIKTIAQGQYYANMELLNEALETIA